MDCTASNGQDGVNTPLASRRCRHPEQAPDGLDGAAAKNPAKGATGASSEIEATSAHAGVTLRVPPFYVLHGPAKLGRSAKLN